MQKHVIVWARQTAPGTVTVRVKRTRGRRVRCRIVSTREAAMSPLSAWVNFYIIVGTAAGVLIGLTFVVISLVAGWTRRPSLSGGGLGTYNTPTVVHFAAVLLACATLSAPWWSLEPVALLLG